MVDMCLFTIILILHMVYICLFAIILTLHMAYICLFAIILILHIHEKQLNRVSENDNKMRSRESIFRVPRWVSWAQGWDTPIQTISLSLSPPHQQLATFHTCAVGETLAGHTPHICSGGNTMWLHPRTQWFLSCPEEASGPHSHTPLLCALSHTGFEATTLPAETRHSGKTNYVSDWEKLEPRTSARLS